jgi:hypothetical protein
MYMICQTTRDRFVLTMVLLANCNLMHFVLQVWTRFALMQSDQSRKEVAEDSDTTHTISQHQLCKRHISSYSYLQFSMKIVNLQLAITIAALLLLPHAQAFSLLTPGKAFRAALDPKNLAPKKGAAVTPFVDNTPSTVVMTAAAAEGSSTSDTQAPKGPAGLNQWDPSAQQINSSKWIEPAVVSKLSSFVFASKLHVSC